MDSHLGGWRDASADLGWKAARLARMTPAEVVLRAWRAGRERLREARWLKGQLPRSYDPLDAHNLRLLNLRTPATDWDRGGFLLAPDLPPAGDPWYGAWLDPEPSGAALCAGWCPLLTVAHIRIATARDWHRDPLGDGEWPHAYGPRMNHRDTANGGARFLWELHRLPQVAVLGREFRRTGDPRYAAAIATVLRSWLRANPPETGIGWQSPLELALRMIAVLHGADLIAGSGAINRRLGLRLETCAALHAATISRSISRGSSANNHTIGEAAGLVIIGAALPTLSRSGRWVAQGLRILKQELRRQFAEDGSGREQAPHYQAFATGFVLQAVRALVRAERPVPSFLRTHLRASSRFLASLVLPNGSAIEPGDGDDGRVHGLSAGPHLAVAETAQAASWEARDWEALPRFLQAQLRPTARWLFGGEIGRYAASRPIGGGTRRSIFHAGAGWALLRGGTPERSLLFDAGPHGLAPLDAHAHADSLSITFWTGSEAIIIDPGTYRYHAGGKWRDYFRSTRAHATIAIDDCDQSEMAGPFLWRNRAQARWSECRLGSGLELVTGEHEGYTRLADPVHHRRRVLHLGEGRFLLHDHVECCGRHHLRMCFPLAPGAHLFRSSGQIDAGGLTLCWETASGSTMRLLLGASFAAHVTILEAKDEESLRGWVSPAFGVRSAGVVIEIAGEIDGDAFLTSYLCSSASLRSAADSHWKAAYIPVKTPSGSVLRGATGLIVTTAGMEETVFLNSAGRPQLPLSVGRFRISGQAALLSRDLRQPESAGTAQATTTRTLDAEILPAVSEETLAPHRDICFQDQLLSQSAEPMVSTS
jgi:hypothetical protein